MTNTLAEMSHPDAPVTRPGFHVTPEGRVIGAADVGWEWEGPEDERTAGVTEVAGVPVVTSKGMDAGLPPNGVDGSPGAPGVGGGVDPGAAAPAVTTSVDGGGNKRTVEHEINVEGTLSHEGVNVLREAIEEAEQTMRQLDRS